MIIIIKSLYFFLPAYFANMAPSFATRLSILDSLAKPIDSGKQYKGFPIFGSHKTWRGIVSGLFLGTLIAYFQILLTRFDFFQKITFFDYQKENILLLGFLLSLGASLGDLVFSFFKRRRGIKAGVSWIPFDQVGFVIGAFLFTGFLFQVPLLVWLLILVFSFFLHIIVNRIGFWLKIVPRPL